MNWNIVLKIIGLVDPIVFLMEHRMLHGIRDHAENWFEHSSHSPMISEMERFNQVLAEKVLARTMGKSLQ